MIAEHRLFDNNEIVIMHKDFSHPYYLTAKRAREFPLEYMKTKAGGTIQVRAIPLNELTKEVISV